jgi:ABC-2 type transport system ATP-binding protein
MSADAAIEVRGVQKRYGRVEALRGLDLCVPRGSLAGLAGLNGAGKTTTLRVLLGITRAGGGDARVLGEPCAEESASVRIRRRTAYLPVQKELFPYMKLAEVIGFTRSFYPAWRPELEQRLVRDFGLDLTRKAGSLSKGQLAKLQLVLSLSRGAELLLLDEPTDGLDPVAAEIALQAMVSLVADSGATILVCSHRLNEIEQIADHLCLIHEGRTLLDEPLDGLKARARRYVMVFDSGLDKAEQALSRFGRTRREGRALSLVVFRDGEAAEAEARALGAASVETHPLNLRELFLEMVKS